MHKQLIVNADDFGFTAGTNAGIVEAHLKGILTATTLMSGGAAFDHAVELARATPSLDVGVHLVLWDEGGLPQRLPAFLRRAASMSMAEIERLFTAQVEKVLGAGIRPSHLDTHKHTHIVPHVMAAMEKTALRFGIGWVRRSLVPHLSNMTKRMSGIRTTDHFLGLRLTGRMTPESLARALEGLKPGLTELMCHPGRYDADLEAAPTRLKQERQRELEALTAPEIRAKLDAAGIQLVNYREA